MNSRHPLSLVLGIAALATSSLGFAAPEVGQRIDTQLTDGSVASAEALPCCDTGCAPHLRAHVQTGIQHSLSASAENEPGLDARMTTLAR
jgi:hypothetical protein